LFISKESYPVFRCPICREILSQDLDSSQYNHYNAPQDSLNNTIRDQGLLSNYISFINSSSSNDDDDVFVGDVHLIPIEEDISPLATQITSQIVTSTTLMQHASDCGLYAIYFAHSLANENDHLVIDRNSYEEFIRGIMISDEQTLAINNFD
jgi:hypothetical protein